MYLQYLQNREIIVLTNLEDENVINPKNKGRLKAWTGTSRFFNFRKILSYLRLEPRRDSWYPLQTATGTLHLFLPELSAPPIPASAQSLYDFFFFLVQNLLKFAGTKVMNYLLMEFIFSLFLYIYLFTQFFSWLFIIANL